MIRTIFAAAVALALFGAPAALACDDCKNCPHHKDTVAQADKGEKKDKAEPAKPGCGCTGAKDCKCGPGCTCANCKAHQKKATEEKKT